MASILWMSTGTEPWWSPQQVLCTKFPNNHFGSEASLQAVVYGYIYASLYIWRSIEINTSKKNHKRDIWKDVIILKAKHKV